MITTDPSLLISDDDLSFRETLESVFAPRGFRILLAGDGEEALHIVRTQEVHLALLDMHMPKLTGLETLRLVKQFKAEFEGKPEDKKETKEPETKPGPKAGGLKSWVEKNLWGVE